MADQQNSGFDVAAARQAGYSDDEILSHLTQSRSFDVDGAIKSGYSKADIIQHLSSTAAPAAGPERPGMPASKVDMQEVQPGVTGLIKDEAKAAYQHPGQAALGALNEGVSLARAALPQGSTTQLPGTTAPTPDPNAPGTRLYNSVAGAVGKVFHPPQSEAEQAGAHGADVAAVAANAPAVVKGAVSLAKSGKDLVKNALTVSPEVKAAANAEIPAELHKTSVATTDQIKQPIAQKLHSTVHDALNQVAQEHGIPIADSASAAAKADKVGRGVLDKAQTLYQQLDDAIGGKRFQTYGEQIETLRSDMDAASVSQPARAKILERRLALAEENFAKAKAQAVDKGVDPDLLKKADALHTQGRALLDVSSKLKSAEDLSGAVKSGAVDRIDSGLKNLRSSPGAAASRLNAAVGQDRADAIRKIVADSQEEIQKGLAEKTDAQAAVKNLKESRRAAQREVDRVSKNRMRLVKTGAATVGLATVGKGLEILHGSKQ